MLATPRPHHYTLHLAPDLESFTFYGNICIEYTLARPTTELTLHSSDLDILQCHAFQQSRSVPCTAQQSDSKVQTITLSFASPLSSDVTVTIVYRGILNDQLVGFYRSDYTNCVSGETSRLAVTQFEPTDARRCFPCVDEPSAKATFQCTLFCDAKYDAISNAPVQELSHVSPSSLALDPVAQAIKVNIGSRKFVYGTTPVMSTYLLAFVVGAFDYIETRSENGVAVRVYTQPGKIHLASFALDVASRALTFFERLYGIPFPLPKVDLLAIPDFSAGAMENWGCITYRETRLLISPQDSSLEAQKRTANTICHELAHMWFGNLVTMEWWTYLWLNEGFARFMEYMAVDYLFPHWNRWTGYISSAYNLALSLASLQSTHPVEVEIIEADSINSSFDAITYAMGSAVIRMLKDMMGEEDFFRGIQQYLAANAYRNCTSNDLWASLAQASSTGIDVLGVMSAWVHHDGYPLVTVKQVKTTATTRVLQLTQTRFYADGHEAASPLWTIPIKIGDGSGKVLAHVLMAAATETVEVQCYSSAALTVNEGLNGVFRTYFATVELLNSHQTLVESKQLNAVDRIGVVDNVAALTKSGAYSVQQLLCVLQWYRNESDVAVMNVVVSLLSELCALHAEEPYYSKLQEFVIDLLKHQFEILTWNASAQEDTSVMSLRRDVIAILGVAKYPPVMDEAWKRLMLFLDEPQQNPLHPDLRACVYSIAASRNTEEAFIALKRIYDGSDLAEERMRILMQIGKIDACLGSIETFLWSSQIKSNYIVYLMASIAKTRPGRAMLWSLLQNEWQRLERLFGGTGGYMLEPIVKVCLQNNIGYDVADQVEKHFSKHPARSVIARRLNEALETIRTNTKRLGRERQVLLSNESLMQ